MHYAASEGGYREKKWKISSYSHSNPLKRALLHLAAKHFDTSLLKITGKEAGTEWFKGDLVKENGKSKIIYFRFDKKNLWACIDAVERS